VACEGAEVILQYAVFNGDSAIVEQVYAAPLLPLRRHRLREWRPAGTSCTLTKRAEAERRRERAADGPGSSCGSSSGCGSSGCGSSCGSSCGGGCGGGD
jgi:uncharacterized membrane protein YgcG